VEKTRGDKEGKVGRDPYQKSSPKKYKIKVLGREKKTKKKKPREGV